MGDNAYAMENLDTYLDWYNSDESDEYINAMNEACGECE